MPGKVTNATALWTLFSLELSTTTATRLRYAISLVRGYRIVSGIEYYDRLMAVRTGGDWEAWLRVFLMGVRDTAEGASKSIRDINHMREEHHRIVQELVGSLSAARLLDRLFLNPIVNVPFVATTLDVSFNTASRLIKQFETAGLLDELTGSQRNRRFQCTPYVRLFQDGGPIASPSEEGAQDAGDTQSA
jgi:Fic family protein